MGVTGWGLHTAPQVDREINFWLCRFLNPGHLKPFHLASCILRRQVSETGQMFTLIPSTVCARYCARHCARHFGGTLLFVWAWVCARLQLQLMLQGSSPPPFIMKQSQSYPQLALHTMSKSKCIYSPHTSYSPSSFLNLILKGSEDCPAFLISPFNEYEAEPALCQQLF